MPTTGAKSIQVKSTTAATYLIRTAGMSSYFLTTHQSSPYATREFTTSSTVWYYLADTSSNPDNLSATGAWNFPTTAGNLAIMKVLISVKNKYDGTYVLKSKLLDWQNNTPFNIANTPFTWPGSTSSYGSILMITAGPTSVKMFDDWGFGTYIHPIKTTTPSWSGFGSTEPKFTFDGTTNALTAATNDFLNPSNGRAFKVNTAVTTSRWDPVTKNIYAAIIMTQPGRSDLQIFDTLVYVGPR